MAKRTSPLTRGTRQGHAPARRNATSKRGSPRADASHPRTPEKNTSHRRTSHLARGKRPKASDIARQVIERLDEQHPNADTELHYSNAYELLVATMLSAQSTDARVNMVTPALFKRYPTAAALARTTPEELEPQILSTGFFRQKSRALIGMAGALVERHAGNVPPRMEDLVELPGVGRKTANVVLGHALGVPGLPVDRHVLRVSNRIGLATAEDPEVVEQQLCASMPQELWTKTSDLLILHGRRVCRPKPLCPACSVRSFCDFYQLSYAAPRVRKAR
ncbi:MAG: endonuclease III [Acidobacteriota bacterium]